jgi:hypothetical protein
MDARYGRILIAKAKEEFVTIRPRGPDESSWRRTAI